LIFKLFEINTNKIAYGRPPANACI